MDERSRTLARLTVIVGFLLLVVIVVGALIGTKRIISPVPDEGAIKIIFISPTLGSISPTVVPEDNRRITPTKVP